MAPPRSPRIEDIDKNFAPNEETAGLRWVDAFDPKVAIRGLGWLAENCKARNFRRFPDRAEASLPPAVAMLSHSTASVFVSFFSNTVRIGVRVSIENADVSAHMPSTGSNGLELYRREGQAWHPMATAIPDLQAPRFERLLMSGWEEEMCEYRLYFPLYKKLKHLQIGFAAGAVVRPAPAPKATKPIVFYGTSITQGGCANTAGSDFVSTLGRSLDAEVINLGFSGNGKGEPEVARLIREIDAEIFVLDYAANCTPERLRETLPEFVHILEKKHPRTPIVLIGNLFYDLALWKNDTRDALEQRRMAMMEFYLQQKQKGHNIYYIDGYGLLEPGIAGTYVDGVHPTSRGFALMAERLEPFFKAIRRWNASGKPAGRRRKK